MRGKGRRERLHEKETGGEKNPRGRISAVPLRVVIPRCFAYGKHSVIEKRARVEVSNGDIPGITRSGEFC